MIVQQDIQHHREEALAAQSAIHWAQHGGRGDPIPDTNVNPSMGNAGYPSDINPAIRMQNPAAMYHHPPPPMPYPGGRYAVGFGGPYMYQRRDVLRI